MKDLPLWIILLGSNVVAALVASGTTLLGVWRQNVANQSRQRAELAHDASERRLEQKVRIYLTAAESLAQMQAYIGSFAATDNTQHSRNELLKGCWGPINQALMVGEQESIESIIRLQEVFALSVIDLDTERGFVDTAIKELRRFQNELDTEQKALIQAVRDGQFPENDESKVDAETQVILGKFQTAMEMQKEVHRKLVALNGSVVKANLVFETQAAQTNIAIRREIGFEIDDAGYANLVLTSSEKVKSRLEENLRRALDFLDQS